MRLSLVHCQTSFDGFVVRRFIAVTRAINCATTNEWNGATLQNLSDSALGVQYSLPLGAGQAVFSEARMFMKTDGTVEVEAVPGGDAFLTNKGDSRAQVQVMRDSEEEKLDLEPGGIVRIEL